MISAERIDWIDSNDRISYIFELKSSPKASDLKKLVIAIDGPAASGKSTTSKIVAARLGYLFIDTGAMYRAMTLKVLEEGIDPSQRVKIGELAGKTQIRLEHQHGRLRVLLDNLDVTDAIRSQVVTRAVSAVSSIESVRRLMVREQRRMGEHGGVVLEGRDIGTVVFPKADLKIFMMANVRERARRRQIELREQGLEISLEDISDQIIERDQMDSERDISPLRKADDAFVVDTSDLTIEEQVDFIVEKAKEILKSKQ